MKEEKPKPEEQEGMLDLLAPHHHHVVDVTVTSARTNTNVLTPGQSCIGS
jgi:hypothetical protein